MLLKASDKIVGHKKQMKQASSRFFLSRPENGSVSEQLVNTRHGEPVLQEVVGLHPDRVQGRAVYS
ncbi:hypothetical protein kam1_1382 [Methylacidiphilum kamchatkense Kam1]|uniref:Uncharacterized protein n=1 Tax=Methylacidiphilum kamchatkense Kam1 TaxID=1202785 RepID=A0A516TN03_9BACT|nr:hypothetical protein kam1_1382 [Methylacidiphilum kamchatkense Kam1]